MLSMTSMPGVGCVTIQLLQCKYSLVSEQCLMMMVVTTYDTCPGPGHSPGHRRGLHQWNVNSQYAAMTVTIMWIYSPGPGYIIIIYQY